MEINGLNENQEKNKGGVCDLALTAEVLDLEPGLTSKISGRQLTFPDLLSDVGASYLTGAMEIFRCLDHAKQTLDELIKKSPSDYLSRKLEGISLATHALARRIDRMFPFVGEYDEELILVLRSVDTDYDCE